MNVASRYVVANWRGELGLAATCLVNGVIGYFLAVAAVTVLGAPLLVLFIAWFIWAGVGVFRTGTKAAFTPGNAPIRRIAGALALTGLLVVAAISARDVWALF